MNRELELMQMAGIAILEGDPTIDGQIKARKKALKYTLKDLCRPLKKQKSQVGFLLIFKEEHYGAIRKLKQLKKGL